MRCPETRAFEATGSRGRSRASRGAAVPCILAVVTFGGCVEDATSGSGRWSGQVRDSSGVAIVENVRSSPDPEAPFRVREIATVGRSTRRDDSGFGYVVDATLAGDTVYVLDALARSVSVWALSGPRLRNFGRPGEGPGELSRFTSAVLLRRDTVLVADWGRGRVHRFLRDGTFVDAPPTSSIGGRSWWRFAGDGRLYVRTLSRYVEADSRWRGEDLLLRPTIGGGAGGGEDGPAEVVVADTVFRFEYPETDVGGPGRPVLPLMVNAPTWDLLPGGRLVWTSLALDELRIHGRGGGLQRIVRAEDWERRQPTDGEEIALAELMGDKMVSLGGSRETVDQIGAVVPRLLPTLTSVRSGPDSTLWVQRMGAAADVHAQALNTPDPPVGWGGGLWEVLDAEGRRLGSVELGSRVRVTRIIEERIVGVRWDDLGREEVVVWEVVGRDNEMRARAE